MEGKSPPAETPEGPTNSSVDLETYVRSRIELEVTRTLINARDDLEAYRDTLPGGHLLVLAVVVAVALLFGLLRSGIDVIYTESVTFMILAVTIGLLGWTAGIVFVLLYAVFDLVYILLDPSARGVRGGEITGGMLLGRFVAVVLLFALVVMIPSAQRSVHARLVDMALDSGRFATWMAWLAALASAVLTGALVYIWTIITPYLIRAAYRPSIFSTRFAPTVEAIAPMQEQGLMIAVIVVVAAFVIAVAHQHRIGIVKAMPRLGVSDADPRAVRMLSLVFWYALFLVLVSGIVTHPIEIIILLMAIVVAETGVFVMNRTGAMRHLTSLLPRTVRGVLALGMAYVLIWTAMERYYRPVDRPDMFVSSEFFPFILGLSLGIVVFRLLIGDNGDVEEGTEGVHWSVGSGAGRFVAFVLIGLGVLATLPDVALAHNCSSLSDCEGFGKGMLATAVAVATYGYVLFKRPRGPRIPRPRIPTPFGPADQLLSEEGAEAGRGWIEWMREKFRKDRLGRTGDVGDYLQDRHDRKMEGAQRRRERLERQRERRENTSKWLPWRRE